jgi:hypothetical protein
MNKKELKKQYAEASQPMGVYQIRNLVNGKIFIESGLNVNGIMNSSNFQLSAGTHFNKALQEDYNKYGQDNFAFEILDYLKPKDDEKTDYREELKLLEEMWIEKLQPFGDKGYN